MTDTDVVITLAKVKRLDLLGRLSGFRFYITDINDGEVKSGPERNELVSAYQAGHLTLAPLTDPTGLATFGRLRLFVDDGEAATVAQASVMNARVAMHDAAGRKAAQGTLGAAKAFRFEDIVVEAVRQRLLTVAEADALAADLRRIGDYVTRAVPGSFQAIVMDPRFGMAP